jgi:hypothetical protein
MRQFRIVATLLGIATSCACFAGDLSLQVETVFVGIPNWFGNCPLNITVENKGPNARGQITITGSNLNFTYTYPIEIPTGSKKRITSYLNSINAYSGIRISLDTDQGSESTLFEFSRPMFKAIAVVGDTIGAIQSIEKLQNNITPVYVKPQNAPDRYIGYADMAAVVLGEGSERLRDDQVRALHEYVLSGGQLYFVGAPGSPVLRDSRWKAICPIESFIQKPMSFGGSERMGRLTATGDFTYLSAKPAPGAYTTMEYRGEPFMIRRRFGTGEAMFIAVDLTERPVSRWLGVPRLLSEQAMSRKPAFWNRNSNRSSSYSSSTYYSSGVPGMSYPPRYSMEESPFDVKLPETSSVLLILSIYVIVVVPLNILVLRKLGRQELAWVTSPIISLAFAAMFFSFASKLYSAGFSRMAGGLVTLDSHSNDGIFNGVNEFFASRGDTYDLQANNVLSVDNGNEFDDYQYRQESSMVLVDVGQYQLDKVSLSNLSFRTLGLKQRLAQIGKLHLIVERNSADEIEIRVKNETPFEISRPQVFSKWGMFNVGSISPGQSLTTKFPRTRTDEQTAQGRPMIHGAILNDVRIGIRLGKLARQSVDLVAVGDYEGVNQ